MFSRVVKTLETACRTLITNVGVAAADSHTGVWVRVPLKNVTRSIALNALYEAFKVASD